MSQNFGAKRTLINIYMKTGFDTIIIIYIRKNLTVPAGSRTQGLRIYASVLWPLSYWDTVRTVRNFHIYWIGHHSQFSNRKTSHLHNVEWSLSGDFLKSSGVIHDFCIQEAFFKQDLYEERIGYDHNYICTNKTWLPQTEIEPKGSESTYRRNDLWATETRLGPLADKKKKKKTKKKLGKVMFMLLQTHFIMSVVSLKFLS